MIRSIGRCSTLPHDPPPGSRRFNPVRIAASWVLLFGVAVIACSGAADHSAIAVVRAGISVCELDGSVGPAAGGVIRITGDFDGNGTVSPGEALEVTADDRGWIDTGLRLARPVELVVSVRAHGARDDTVRVTSGPGETTTLRSVLSVDEAVAARLRGDRRPPADGGRGREASRPQSRDPETPDSPHLNLRLDAPL